MTIWHNKDEKPIKDGDTIIKLGNGIIIVSDLENMFSFDVVKWCYLNDLLALEQQNESLYQNQKSIIETNNVLIRRLKETDEIIKENIIWNNMLFSMLEADSEKDKMEEFDVFYDKVTNYLSKYKDK